MAATDLWKGVTVMMTKNPTVLRLPQSMHIHQIRRPTDKLTTPRYRDWLEVKKVNLGPFSSQWASSTTPVTEWRNADPASASASACVKSSTLLWKKKPVVGVVIVVVVVGVGCDVGDKCSIWVGFKISGFKNMPPPNFGRRVSNEKKWMLQWLHQEKVISGLIFSLLSQREIMCVCLREREIVCVSAYVWAW